VASSSVSFYVLFSFLLSFSDSISNSLASLVPTHSVQPVSRIIFNISGVVFNLLNLDTYTCPLCRKPTGIPHEDTQLKSLIEKVAFLLDHSSPPETRFDYSLFKQFFNANSIVYVRR